MSEMDEIYRRAAAQIQRDRDLGLLPMQAEQQAGDIEFGADGHPVFFGDEELRARIVERLKPECLNESQPVIGGFASNICRLPLGHAGAHSDRAGSYPMMWLHAGESRPIGHCVDDGTRLEPEHWPGVTLVPFQEAKPVAVEPEKHIDLRTVDGFLKHLVANPLAYEPATCRDCSAPATSYGTRCKYCEHRAECEPIGDDGHSSVENREARARMLAADERERPKSSATSREMAKAHPWHSDENEP